MSEPLIVQAVYNFKGTNNDELCFKKGDRITVTQKEDGGWWEGTLGDKTGWFPSNYVKECKEVNVPLSPVSQHREYRAVVLKDLIDSEKAHVIELQGLLKNFLKPLEKRNLLSTDEYRQLTGNINEVVDTHQQLLDLVEECETKPSEEQRVGKLFLTWAPRIKGVHQMYCSLHPKAVCILDLHKYVPFYLELVIDRANAIDLVRDELATYMESCGAATPGLLVLTAGLSKPFRRLDKYSGMLQELERHVELNHPDRGDIQRSVAVYKDIATTCAATRRQKELELQVLTGPVRGWEGQSLAQLGDILHMGSVTVGSQHQDRYLVLFPNTLLMLSVSHRMSAFIYEGKLPLTNITVTKLDDTDNHKNAFEISGPLIEKIIACCQNKDEASHWVEILRQHTNKGHLRSPPPPSNDGVRQTSHMSPLNQMVNVNRQNQNLQNQVNLLNPGVIPMHGTTLNNNKRGWSATCLRPTPPLRPCLALSGTPQSSPQRSMKLTLHDEDAKILHIIEAYCTTTKPKSTVNTGVGPQMKTTDKLTETNMMDNMKTLQNEVKELQCSIGLIMVQLTEEKMARTTLQNIIKNHLITNSKEADKIQWPKLT